MKKANRKTADLPKAFLFDLDDTIFDHQFSRRTALDALMQARRPAGNFDLKVLEAIHDRHLQTTYLLVLDGKISAADAHRERMRLLFAEIGLELSADDLTDVAAQYRSCYDGSRRSVPGAVELVKALKKQGKVGIITNGLIVEQHEKIRLCGLAGLFDAVVVSEQAGVKKPHRDIFELALKELGAPAGRAVMIGDSWSADVLGARGAGISAVWLNRYAARCPEPGFAVEINSLDPVDLLLATLSPLIACDGPGRADHYSP